MGGELEEPDALEGWTPLHWAVLSDNPKAVVYLLKRGVDKEARDFAGRKAEDLVEDYWGDFYKRYWEHGPKNNGLPQPDKAHTKKLKQLKDAFKQNAAENEFDIIGYKAIQV